MSRGKYKHRIEIEEETTIRNPVTKLNEKQWVSFYKCWAEIDQRGRVIGVPTNKEVFQASVEHSEFVVTFIIRYKDGIKTRMRVIFEGKRYEIEQVKPDLQRKLTTSLQCKEVV